MIIQGELLQDLQVWWNQVCSTYTSFIYLFIIMYCIWLFFFIISSIKIQGNGYLIWTNVVNRFSAILPYVKDDRKMLQEVMKFIHK